MSLAILRHLSARALLAVVTFGIVAACSSQSEALTTTSSSENATCHGEPFGQVSMPVRGDSPDDNIHAAVAEADMVERGGQEVARIGDFNVSKGRVHFEFQAPPSTTVNNMTDSAAKSSGISGDFILSRSEAETLVCAANRIWGDPNSVITPGTRRLSQLVLWRFDQRKEVSGEGDLAGASKAFVDAFWTIVAQHKNMPEK